MSMPSALKRAPRNEFTVEATRLLPVAREHVFACWTRAEHLSHWFGPRRFTIHSCETDARPGGIFRLCMRSPERQEFWVDGRFVEFVAPERLVIECTASDEGGAHILDEVIRVTFAVEGKGTRLSLHATAAGAGDRAAKALSGMRQGWSETLDRLGERASAKTTKG
jgi:uncharacterized protein YndB with AHSA1/START domain